MGNLFPLGAVLVRPGAAEALARADMSVSVLLDRHMTGDWGSVRTRDRLGNEGAVQDGRAIVSAYTLHTGDRIIVITSSDRQRTIALLAQEYQRQCSGAERVS